MTTLRTAAQQALEALEKYQRMMLVEAGCQSEEGEAAITALKAALAEPVQEPVAWLWPHQLAELKEWKNEGNIRAWSGRHYKPDGVIPVYAAPPQPEECNFCPRCGKRTQDIHTCTPPGDSDVHC